MIVLGITTSIALAAATRAEYVAQVDPICQASTQTQKQEFRKFKRRLSRLKAQGLDLDEPTKPALRIGVRFYDRIARIQRGTNDQIAAVLPAPGDEGPVAEWLRLRGKHTSLVNHAIHGWARNRKAHQFRRLMNKATLAEINAESAVADFDFRYCTPFLAD